jgi:predicted PurR-regulated permease PerM
MSDETLVPRKWRKPLFLTLAALVFGAVVVLAHEVMAPFVIAIVLAYVLTPAVSFVERRVKRRGLAIVIVYIAVLGSLGVFVRLAAPRIGQELGSLGREAKKNALVAKEEWIPGAQTKLDQLGVSGGGDAATDPDKAPAPALVVKPQPDGSYAVDVGSGFQVEQKGQSGFVVTPREPEGGKLDLNKLADEAIAKSVVYLQSNAVELVKFGGNLVASISRAIFVFGITLMLAAYVMLTREKILAFFGSLVRPDARPAFEALLARVDRGLSGVVRGQLLICLVNGALTAVGFALVGLKYWPVLALIATVLSLIPIFGVIVSSVPAVAIGLTQGIGIAAFVLGWIVVIHQIEANFLNPKIMGDAAKLHPVLVIFSLIVGEHFFHALGALLAVPVMSIAQSLFLHFRAIVEERDPRATDPPPPVKAAPVDTGEASR